MHPLYKRIRRKTLFIGTFAIIFGFFGLLVPVLPGTLLVLLGLSLLSLQLKIALRALVVIRTRYPKIASPVKRAETQLVNFFHLTTHGREHSSIPSKNGGAISILSEPSECIAGTAVLLHSASGIAEMKVMNTLSETFKIRGFSVVRFNAENGLGDSAGDFSKFSTSSYRNNLDSVLEWAKVQPWWQKPLILVGHSLGGLIAGLYASEHQTEIDELILLAPSLSGGSLKNNLMSNDREMYEAWQKTGERVILHPISHEKYTLPFSFLEDMEQYSLLTKTENLSMPVTIFSGTCDTISPSHELESFCNTIDNHAILKKLVGVGHIPHTRHENDILGVALSEMCLQSNPIIKK